MNIVIERRYKAKIEDVWALWTTKEGFELWWGPQGFRVEVNEIEARLGGTLRYDMITDSSEMIEAMQAMGQATSHPTSSRFSEFLLEQRLVMTNNIDFLPGVPAYENNITVDFQGSGAHVMMRVSLESMHSEAFTQMQLEGFSSQLSKLDQHFEI